MGHGIIQQDIPEMSNTLCTICIGTEAIDDVPEVRKNSSNICIICTEEEQRRFLCPVECMSYHSSQDENFRCYT